MKCKHTIFVWFSAIIFVGGCDQPPMSQSIDFDENLATTLAALPPIDPVRLQQGRVGLGLIPRNYNDSINAWVESLEIAKHFGVQVLQLPAGYWREDEPIQGEFQWYAMQRFVKALEIIDYEFEVSQDFGGPFFHDRNMAPDFLQPIELTDAKFADAYVTYLNNFLDRFGPHITRVLIHAEGSYSYFEANPTHLNAYLGLLQRIVKETHAKWPKIRIGVNIDPNNEPEILSAISREVDFVGFDIVQIEDYLEKPDDLSQVVDSVLSNTAGKPISLACGWSSASGLGGGDMVQSEFYESIFHQLRKHRARIEYIVVGPPFDEDKEIVGPAYKAQFAHLPTPFVDKIIDWITQLGLIRIDGSAKPALTTVRDQIHSYYADYTQVER